jgi:hypothetical protein
MSAHSLWTNVCGLCCSMPKFLLLIHVFFVLDIRHGALYLEKSSSVDGLGARE